MVAIFKNTLHRLFFLITAVCFSIVTILLIQRYLPRQKILAQEKASLSADQLLPAKLIINELDIVLPIFPANKKTNGWETTNQGVSYLQDSVIPGEAGLSIFYGHNWPNLLKNLLKAKIGQEILIINRAGEIKYFVITKTELINERGKNFLSETTKPRLIIYTCTGFFDQNRFLVTAIPI